MSTKRPDVNQPSEWKKYRSGLCDGCWSGCCTMPVEIKASDLVRMELADEAEIETDPRRVAKRLIREGILRNYRESTGLFMLESKSNGDCMYLDKDRRCMIYDKRPEVCRKFPTEMSRRLGYCPAGAK